MPTVLYFLGVKPKLEDGQHWSAVRCTCSTRANLCAVVEGGVIVRAGCPVCGQEAVVEVTPDGAIGFFPMGVEVI